MTCSLQIADFAEVIALESTFIESYCKTYTEDVNLCIGETPVEVGDKDLVHEEFQSLCDFTARHVQTCNANEL